MTAHERMLYATEYIQRYHQRILNQGEIDEFLANKQNINTTSILLGGLIPAQVVLTFQIRYHFEHYSPMFKKVSFATGIVGLLWYKMS